MNRRDFLLLRRVPSSRIVELSCQQLYVRYLDTKVTGGIAGGTGDRQEADASPDPWGGEPSPVFDERTFADVLRSIEDALCDADVVRLHESAWLACEDVRKGLDGVLEKFRARGGRVQPEGSELRAQGLSPKR